MRRGAIIVMHGRSRKTIDSRIPTMPGPLTLLVVGVVRPGYPARMPCRDIPASSRPYARYRVAVGLIFLSPTRVTRPFLFLWGIDVSV